MSGLLVLALCDLQIPGPTCLRDCILPYLLLASGTSLRQQKAAMGHPSLGLSPGAQRRLAPLRFFFIPSFSGESDLGAWLGQVSP